MDLSLLHQQYMQQALNLASKGLGSVAPNPMVGSVIVKDNAIIGSGHTQPYGEAHAEVMAIHSVADKSLLKNSTLYVTLEPCAHYGKTPPCADLIIEHKIPSVVIACLDTFKQVNGKGIEKLIKAGIDVTIGVLEKEARWLNRRFFIFNEQKRPYIILKWAQTADGFISKLPVPKDRKDNTISHANTSAMVHVWRSQEQAILVGSGTVIADNPLLNVRLVKGKHPIRFIIDSNNELNKTYGIFNDTSAKTIVFNHQLNLALEGVEQIQFKENQLIKIINQYCFENGIQSILVEGGLSTHNYFIENNLYDEVRIIKAPKTFLSGVEAPNFPVQKANESYEIGNDEIEIYYNAKTEFNINNYTLQNKNYSTTNFTLSTLLSLEYRFKR
jgi:diaminohydroxyphosphoribosylaminopyrimidine deaminase / 5-amino-6-(5-phosphoribosylamino)uracil reductase